MPEKTAMPERVADDVTEIKLVVNMTNGPVIVYNLEQPDGRDNMTVPANDVGISGAGNIDNIPMFIPWCDDSNKWKTGHILVRVNTKAVEFCIWQSGSKVRYCTDNVFHPNGQPVPGYADIRGERVVVIDKQLNLTFVLIASY